MDESNVRRARAHGYTGAVVHHRAFTGARVSRIMHPPGQRIEPHRHSWPVITLYRAGGYREENDDGAVVTLDGPSAVVQPAGAAHSDEVGARGLETLAMSFDPDWLEPEARAALPERTQWRRGGAVGEAVRALSRVWLATESADERAVRRATSQFLLVAAAADTPSAPRWGAEVEAALDEARRTEDLARSLSRHPAWLARAYRAWRGEGLGESVRRRRVERATVLLRESPDPLAQIASEAGFADQPHMNRCFRAVLGRTPLEVRREAALLAPLATR